MTRGVFYNRTGDVIEVTIRDGTYSKVETRRALISNQEEVDAMMKWLKDKYGFCPTIDHTFLKK